MNRIKKNIALIALIGLSLLTHFIYFGHPNETVFDEVHFGKFISGYFTHEYFFDIHPPLGKLLISGAGYLGGFKPGFSFAEIGQKFSDNTYLWLRFLPTLAGVLLPIVIFYLILNLGMSRMAAFSGGILVTLESAILVQSRFILLDAFLLLFGFLALLLYLIYRKRNKMIYLFLAVAAAGLSASVKWTGLTFLGLIGIAELAHILMNKRLAWRQLLATAGCFLIAPLLYFSIFWIHLHLLTKSGQGDAFMTTAFQKTLQGSRYKTDIEIKPKGTIDKFIELNKEMYVANATLTAGHPYASRWYTWPFMVRPIYYWYQAGTDSQAGLASRIYFMGNPVIWWLSTIALLYIIIDSIPRLADLKRLREFAKSRKIELMLIGAYLVNLLPFVGIKRAMFLYHYMIGYIFAILALIYIMSTLNNKKLFVGLITLSAIAFLFFAPIIYGLPISDHAYHLRTWFASWQ